MSTGDNFDNISRPEVRSNFSKIPNQLINSPHLLAYEKLLAIYIMSFKVCFASQAAMSRDLRISKSTVQRNMAGLFRKNVVRKVSKSDAGWECIYVVNPMSKWKTGER